jgi:spore germination cell wall hydrolase CwlJ-like protein
MAHGYLSYQQPTGEVDYLSMIYRRIKEYLDKREKKTKTPDEPGGKLANIPKPPAPDDGGPVQEVKVEVGSNTPPSQHSSRQNLLKGSSFSALAGANRKALPGQRAINPDVVGMPPVASAFGGKRLKGENYFGDAIVDIGATNLGVQRDFGGDDMFIKRLNGVDDGIGGGSEQIVQSIDRLTFVTMSLVAATKEQTQQQGMIAAAQQQQAEKLARSAQASAEENAMELGGGGSGGLSYQQLLAAGTGAIGGGSRRGGGPGMGIGGKALAKNLLQAGVKRGGARAGTRLGAALGGKLAGGMGTKLGAKLGATAVGKVAGGALAKSLGKKIPLVGLGLGAVFAAQRAMQGDFLGAGLELASGAASTVPGIGTAGSVGIDAALAARDVMSMQDGGIPLLDNQLIQINDRPDKKREAVMPLTRKTFLQFGEGVFEAQRKNETKFAKLQSTGLKQYYENEGGFEKMGEILGNIFKGLGNGLRSIFDAFTGGAANAATRGLGGGLVDPTLSGDEEEYLLRLMIAEAGGEGEVGMAAVGRSVLNRAGLIQSGEVRAGTFNAASGSIMDVINAEGQYQPVREGKLKRDLSPEERARAKKALEMARNQASLRGNLEAQGLAADQINKIMASTGFRTKTAGYDASQDVNTTALGAHVFNTAGNSKMLTPTAEVKTGGPGAATFGETGRVFNKEGYVHGHFQTDTGTKADLVNDVLPVVKALLSSGVKDVSITSGEEFTANMSDAEMKALIEKGIGKHTHSGDGRSVDIFVPKGTPVPFPLADVKTGTGNEGRSGILPGSGKVWVGHLTPESKSGVRAHTAQEPKTDAKGPQAAATPAGKKFNIEGAPELSNLLNAANPQDGNQLQVASAQVASGAVGGTTIINNNYATPGSGNGGGARPANVPIGPGSNDMGISPFYEFALRTA